MSKIQKASAVTTRKGFVNPMINSDGNQRLDTFDYSGEALKTQLLPSGAVEKLADDLTNHLKQHRVVRLSTQCKGCKQSFVPQRLVLNVLMCRKCLGKAQEEESISRQNRFVAEAARNYVASLRYQISVGGAR